jgi:hypothetical protein
MRHLNNFVGNSRGRNIVPSDISFSNISTECSSDPDFYVIAYSSVRIVGISNTINLQISGPGAASENLSLWYRVTTSNRTPDANISPSAVLDPKFNPISFDLFSGLTAISGITNGYYLQFGVEALDPYGVYETYTSTVRVSNVSPGITLGSFDWSNNC